MNVVRAAEDLARLYQTTRATAQAVFGDSRGLPRALPRGARHTEVQLLRDRYGNGVYSWRARLLGATPPPEAHRGGAAIHLPRGAPRHGERAVRGALSVGYTGAGTIEFLLDATGTVYFMEMNARIQVEHPVTEMVTGIDLVREQIRVAAGEPLRSPGRPALRGHAIECRVNAEDPDRDFAPAPGRSTTYVPPGGPCTRVDTHGYPG